MDIATFDGNLAKKHGFMYFALKDDDLTNLRHIESIIIKWKGKCASCGEWLAPGFIQSYDHDGGIRIQQFDSPQWIYFNCECGYQSALWKVMNGISAMIRNNKDCHDVSHTHTTWISINSNNVERWFIPENSSDTLAVEDWHRIEKIVKNKSTITCKSCGNEIIGKHATTTQLFGDNDE